MVKFKVLKKIGKKIELFFSRIKQVFIIFYLVFFCGGRDVIKKYKKRGLDDVKILTDTVPIWTCWWQGYENMPLVVKSCYKSIQMHANNHPVILITERNYSKYVDFPEVIIQKLRDGIIDLTHFSDILRMALLSKYGGIWMDCTLLIPLLDIDTFLPKEKFWSCHHYTKYNNVSRGGWTSFFFACGENNPLPAFILDMHLKYWKSRNNLIDYLLLDYVFAIAMFTVPCIHNMVKEVPMTKMGPLGKLLNDEYTEKKWRKLCEDYNFHKLTYKIPLHINNEQGKRTFYGHIVESFAPCD